ncbi:MAG: AAC(3) family N-acetyltransferase [Alphaproteobacteria bacterium]|nr:AAC(3) family N-acetyltransferase [Alphaproteobacteria bacterium]MDP6589216.1 AAC(3) family N-acetyltransferase [Alphaproteobacteria bacterium]MDP6816675.1 AAC(3) family N-acetyltransferase [Alphaproteobacteria bacterium]
MASHSATLVTPHSFTADLHGIGVRAGDVLCVHLSMKSLGFVIGGARTIIEGLSASVGEAGTLMMPTYSGDLSDPAEWAHPAVPSEWVETIRGEMPAYDASRTPTRGMGVVPELFRHQPGVVRSPHPQSSFAALGPDAGALVGAHPLDNRFGPDSPLGQLMALGGKVLLLGAPYDTTALFHLTQHLVGGAERVTRRSPVTVEGHREWAEYSDVNYPIDWFDDGMAMLIDKGIARLGTVGAARTVLLPATEAVEAAVAWRRRTSR